MKLIPIIKSSIRKNPDYGQSVKYMPGRQSVTFTIIGEDKPDGLVEGTDYVVTGWDGIGGAKYYCQLNDPAKLEMVKGYGSTFQQDLIEIPMPYQPKFLYEHDTTTEIKCLSCGVETPLELIPYEFDDYSGGKLMTCPHCGEVNEFEAYEFEKLN